MKTCPYCAEEIQDAAIKCKHCHEMLDLPPAQARSSKKKGERSVFDLFMAFFVAGPFMLPMIWWHPKLSREAKIISTVLVLFVFGLVVWGFVWALMQFYDYWDMLDRISQGG